MADNAVSIFFLYQ